MEWKGLLRSSRRLLDALLRLFFLLSFLLGVLEPRDPRLVVEGLLPLYLTRLLDLLDLLGLFLRLVGEELRLEAGLCCLCTETLACLAREELGWTLAGTPKGSATGIFSVASSTSGGGGPGGGPGGST